MNKSYTQIFKRSFKWWNTTKNKNNSRTKRFCIHLLWFRLARTT